MKAVSPRNKPLTRLFLLPDASLMSFGHCYYGAKKPAGLAVGFKVPAWPKKL